MNLGILTTEHFRLMEQHRQESATRHYFAHGFGFPSAKVAHQRDRICKRIAGQDAGFTRMKGAKGVQVAAYFLDRGNIDANFAMEGHIRSAWRNAGV